MSGEHFLKPFVSLDISAKKRHYLKHGQEQVILGKINC